MLLPQENKKAWVQRRRGNTDSGVVWSPAPHVSCCAQESEGLLGTSTGFEYICGLQIQSQMRRVQMVPAECRVGGSVPWRRKKWCTQMERSRLWVFWVFFSGRTPLFPYLIGNSFWHNGIGTLARILSHDCVTEIKRGALCGLTWGSLLCRQTSFSASSEGGRNSPDNFREESWVHCCHL